MEKHEGDYKKVNRKAIKALLEKKVILKVCLCKYTHLFSFFSEIQACSLLIV